MCIRDRLIQFSWSFKSSPENREYLIDLQKRFREYPLVVEVRHASWLEQDILDLLSELRVGICNIDQPLFHRSVKPSAHVTSTSVTSACTVAITRTGSLRTRTCANDTIIFILLMSLIHGLPEPSRSLRTHKIRMWSQTITIWEKQQRMR